RSFLDRLADGGTETAGLQTLLRLVLTDPAAFETKWIVDAGLNRFHALLGTNLLSAETHELGVPQPGESVLRYLSQLIQEPLSEFLTPFFRPYEEKFGPANIPMSLSELISNILDEIDTAMEEATGAALPDPEFDPWRYPWDLKKEVFNFFEDQA